MRDWHAVVRAQLARERTAPALHGDAIDELAAHLADVYRTALAAGATPAAAEAAADAELAGLGPLAAALDTRAHRAFQAARPKRRLWPGLAADVRQAARLIRRRPGLSMLAVLMLALGVGVSTTVFGIYNAVLVAGLPYPRAADLVLLWEGERASPDDTYIVAAPVYEDWRARQRTLAALGLWEFVSFNIRGAGDPEQVPGIRASASVFHTIGIAPALGRTFTDDEDRRGAKVAVLSDAAWRSHFAGDPGVPGRQIQLNGMTYDVIGVMPPDFAFPRRATAVFVPMSFTTRDRQRTAHSFYVIGRARDGVTFEQVRDDFARIGDELAREYPANAGETSRPTRLADFGMTTVRKMLAALGGASVFVLLIAGVNVANLLIARALDRRREFGLRRALGAGGGRLIRQLLIEGLSLAGLSAVGGVFIAWIGTRVLDLLLGADFLTFWFRGRVPVTLEPAVLGFALAAAVMTALIFSCAPIAGLRGAAVTPALRDGGRGVAHSAFGVRRVLVAAEVGLAIVVLCGAGLVVKSFIGLLRVDPGLNPDRVLTLQVSLPQEDTYGPAIRRTFCEEITAAAAGGPFPAIGAISHLPLDRTNASRALSIEGRPHDPEHPVSANYRLICPGYFRTLGIPVVRGRDVEAADREPVVVINRAMADRYWKDQNPIGHRIRIGRTEGPPWIRIVGVAENVKHFGLESDPVHEIFVPYRQNAWPVMTVVARTRDAVTPAAATALRDVLRRTYPEAPATTIRSMNQVIDTSLSWRVSFLRLLLVYAGLGLLLAAVGVYGVLAYFVSQRSQEMGIRIALGATAPAIVRLVLRQSLAPVAAGVFAGAAASIWSGRLLTDLLFQTEPSDPAVLTSVSAFVLLVGMAASWVPAHRASNLDPTVTLRGE
jgi:putative ABC transport system permease protein